MRRARGPADGSEDSPFSTIAGALAHALKLNSCGVELRLSAGTYAETVQAPLHLKLRGEKRGVVINGSIVNHDGWALGIERLQIRSAAMPGAIVTDSLCPSDTEISRVGISAATGFGVFQRGGRLRNHEIGIFLNPDPPEPEAFNDAFHCLTDRVSFHNNRRNVDGLFVPVPDDGSGDPPVCVRVPFDCSWCDL